MRVPPPQGRTYLCKKLDLSTKVAVVRPADLKYYTKTRDFTDVHVIGGRKAFASHNSPVRALPLSMRSCCPNRAAHVALQDCARYATARNAALACGCAGCSKAGHCQVRLAAAPGLDTCMLR